MKDQELYSLKRQVNHLKIFSLLLTILIGAIFIFGFVNINTSNNSRTLEVERLDIIEPDGSLALSFSNSENARPPKIDYQRIGFASERNSPAIIFYDGKGDEVGGLLLSNVETEDGYMATRHFSFDGYKQDQTITLRHVEQNGMSLAGLMVQDRPGVSLLEAIERSGLEESDSRMDAQQKLMEMQQNDPDSYNELWKAPTRLFAGKNPQGSSVVNLHDANGMPRMQLEVTAEGHASINFFNEEGEIIDTITAKN